MDKEQAKNRVYKRNLTLPPYAITKLLKARRYKEWDTIDKPLYLFRENSQHFIQFMGTAPLDTTNVELKTLGVFTVRSLEYNSLVACGKVPEDLTEDMIVGLGEAIYLQKVSRPMPNRSRAQSNKDRSKENQERIEGAKRLESITKKLLEKGSQ